MMSKNMFIISLIVLLMQCSNMSYAEEYLGINYDIIGKKVLSKSKISIDVRIDRKVEKPYLTFFAMRIRNSINKQYDRMFISYYLPGMPIGSGAWATSHFTPELDCRILGSSIEEDNSISVAESEHSNTYGEWIDNQLGASYRIFRKNENYLMSITYKDGSNSEHSLVETYDPRGKRFNRKDKDKFGGYYIVYPNNLLGIFDRDGIIVKIKAK